MLALLIGSDVRFGIDTIEIERSGLSYTVDTLADLARRYPDAERFFRIGEDLVDQVDTLRAADRLTQLAEGVVLVRGDATDRDSGRFGRLTTRRVDVSST